MNLIEKLQEIQQVSPERTLISLAIEKLVNPKDVAQFYKDYKTKLRTEGVKEPDICPRIYKEVGEAFESYKKENFGMWMRIISAIEDGSYSESCPSL